MTGATKAQQKLNPLESSEELARVSRCDKIVVGVRVPETTDNNDRGDQMTVTVPGDVMEAARKAHDVSSFTVETRSGWWSLRALDAQPRDVALVCKTLSPLFPKAHQMRTDEGEFCVFLRTVQPADTPAADEQPGDEPPSRVTPAADNDIAAALASTPYANARPLPETSEVSESTTGPKAVDEKGNPVNCLCGCGEQVSKGRKFRQGHDARYHGMQKRAEAEATWKKKHPNVPIDVLVAAKHNIEKAEARMAAKAAAEVKAAAEAKEKAAAEAKAKADAKAKPAEPAAAAA